MNDGLHYCTAKACKAEIPLTLLMCGPHWRMVPLALQREVYRTWREFNVSKREMTPQEQADRLRAYQGARHKAIRFVDDALIVKAAEKA